jgi:hypothetical protein
MYRTGTVSIYGSTVLFVGPWQLFQFLDLFTQSVGLLGREISPSQGRYLLYRTAQTHNKRTQISMHPVGFEPAIAVFERALDRAATVTGEQKN